MRVCACVCVNAWMQTCVRNTFCIPEEIHEKDEATKHEIDYITDRIKDEDRPVIPCFGGSANLGRSSHPQPALFYWAGSAVGNTNTA